MDSKMTGALADAITNVTTIKMFSKIPYEIKRFASVTHKLFQARLRSWHAGNLLNLFQSVSMSSIQLFIIFTIINLWAQNKISIGTIVLIQTYVIHIYSNLWDLGRVLRDLYTAMVDAEEMVEILEQKSDISDANKLEQCLINQGKIQFKDVHFSYVDNTQVFADLNLTIQPGQKIGIVGESGAGKTTITKLLLRFADIDSGQILIDNQSIYQISQNDLRKNIAFVPQDPILFHRSLLDNIKYGKLDASKKEVMQAAKKAHAHEFILNSPQKYQTFVGERGIKLSGGEKQRVAIARAILKNTPILILDEATSSLDSKSEKLIQVALENLMKNKTTIIIAHRLSTLRKMDKIIVFDNGKIIEQGTHPELIKKKGQYFNLWTYQTS